MNDELKNKLLQDLEKSGFASEMQTMRTIRRAGWHCSGAGTYFDRDACKTRTIDVEAYSLARDWEVGDGGVEFEYHLFIEVKKAERPWIVFRQKEQYENSGDAWHNPYFSHNEALSLGKLVPALHKYSIRKDLGWLGYGVHEAFKEPQDTGRWYAAAVTACKAAYDYVRIDSFKFLEKSENKQTFLAITQPVVVLDGPLISAEIAEDQTVALEDVPFAPFEFEFSTACYEASNYRIDLVRITSLEAYLNVLKQRVEAIFTQLHDAKRLHNVANDSR
ncbi:MAG: hypothetical protein HZA90_01025 [Verrucomicrobia bacterium]|nr:hypothetical protein [Verrucomicrobiota bacterium]